VPQDSISNHYSNSSHSFADVEAVEVKMPLTNFELLARGLKVLKAMIDGTEIKDK